jgi:hypothetical protein
MSAEPVRGGLCASRFDVHFRAVRPDGDKQPRSLVEPRRTVGERHRIAGVIDEQLIAGNVGQCQRHSTAVSPRLELHAKCRVFESVRVSVEVCPLRLRYPATQQICVHSARQCYRGDRYARLLAGADCFFLEQFAVSSAPSPSSIDYLFRRSGHVYTKL